MVNLNQLKKLLLQNKYYILTGRVGLLALLSIFLSGAVLGQNLIKNPSFEQISACPTAASQINLAKYWHNAGTISTADLFHVCATDTSMQLPFSYESGEQTARTGGSVARIAVYCDERIPNWANHEYIQTLLADSMKAGHTYYVEFYTLPQEKLLSIYHHYTDAIGMAVADSIGVYEQFETPEGKIIHLEPILEHRGELITDFENWTRVSGSYRAVGGEKAIIIGNFRLDTETKTFFGSLNVAPYLKFDFIDDVLVMEFDPVPDTVILCEESSDIELGNTFLDGKYQWSTGETDSVITVNQPGQYVVEVTIGDAVMYDTTQVVFAPLPYDYQLDTTVCNDELLTIQPSVVGRYMWSDGSVEKSRILDGTGYYELTISNRCGDYHFSYDMDVKNCECPIFVPNVFSPNGDGINDLFEFYPNCDYLVEFLSLKVFDRWGSMVFQSTDTDNLVWDGMYKGKPLGVGVYIWVLDYEIFRKGEKLKKMLSGDVAIFR